MHHLRQISLLIAALIISLAFAACGDPEEQGSDNSSVAPEDIDELCEAACGAVYDECGETILDESQTEMSRDECHDACVDEDLFQGNEWCVATEAECSAQPMDMVDECFDTGKPDDPEELCEAACNKVYSPDGCEQIFLHDNGGAMSETACVEQCLDEDLFHGGEWCVASRAECQSQPSEMIDACIPDDYHVEACAHLGAWDHEVSAMEERVVEETNRVRSEGTTCVELEDPNDETSQLISHEMPPVGPVEMDVNLRCAARLHSVYMSEQNNLSHTGEGGSGPGDRAQAAGYSGGGVGENIAQGYSSPESVVEGWRTSETGHCRNMMTGGYSDIGVGLDGAWWWTQKFGG